jgi:hypothetical protein
MIPFFRWLGLAVLCATIVLPTLAADKDGTDSPSKKTTDKSDKKKDKAEDEYVQLGQQEGIVLEPPAGTRFKMQIITRAPDQAAIARMGQLQVQLAQQKAQGNKNNGFNLGAIQNTLAQIAVQQAAVARGVEQKSEKMFDAAEDAKVRVAEPPIEFDDKGARKKYTQAQLKEKKGPGNHWGYPGTFDQLAKGQNVKLFLGLKKSTVEAMKKKKKPVTRPKTKPKDADDEPSDENTPVVFMIYILADPKP